MLTLSYVKAALVQTEPVLAADELLREVEARLRCDAELEAVVSGKSRRADLAVRRGSLDKLGWAWSMRKSAHGRGREPHPRFA